MIKVVHKSSEPNHIYCGRGSVLGNPFEMGNESERDKVCEQYKKYFHQKVEIEKDETILKELRIIYKKALHGDVNLGCYCAPKRCHCETIKEFIEKKLKEAGKLTETAKPRETGNLFGKDYE
jgi:hypothetical protein